MRLIVCGLSAVLLSGCSWLGGLGIGSGAHHGPQAKSSHYAYGGQYGAKAHNRGGHNPCQIFSPQQPIPRGCDPASVTLATPGSQYGGFPQEPNFGGGYGAQYGGQSGQYASQGYGSHAGVAGQQAAHYNPRKQLRKPRWRGAMSLGVEKSFSGSLLEFASVPTLDPVAGYNPQTYNEGVFTGSPASGSTTNTTWTANDQNLAGYSVLTPNQYEEAIKPDISFDDVYTTPLRVAGGVEYIMGAKTTLFANAGYSKAEGKNADIASINATLYRLDETQNYVPAIAPATGYIADGPLQISTSYIPNQQIARFAYDFTDMERIDFEVGGRHYLNPLIKDQGFKTLTPFVGASVGASHYNGVSFNTAQSQLHYERSFESGGDTQDFYTITGPTTRVDLYDSQWVPSGQLNAGVEWQLTPKTAMAFETGVRIEGAREYSNGAKGSTNVAIPLTIRGSYNF